MTRLAETPALRPSGPSLDEFARRLCAELGAGYQVQAPAGASHETEALHVWTPERGCLSLRRSGGEFVVQAIGWPVVAQLGLRRRFGREIGARVAIDRDIRSAARDLRRRVIEPYRLALAEARSAESSWRSLLQDVTDCARLAGLSTEELHAVGRTLQARRPLGALDESGHYVASQCTNTIHLQDEGALGSFEAHYLSLAELAELNRFIDTLVARRRPSLRLRA
ncbi:hypothetical protein AAG565_07530 [Fontimonas sp. SYSU GA230001]|uniref:hypothetical protein n=1 Tax=Fontimonas sp. SYSU GA230001 TaxID=3142450 RepID=UPI0032B4438C